AAWNRVESRVTQPCDRIAQVEPADFGDVGDLGRRETVQMNPRAEALLDRAQQILVPFDLQIRMQAALHQDARAAKVESLLDLPEDCFMREDVAFLVAHRTVEGAETAILCAEVRVIDVAVDDVADYALGMNPAADRVGLHADADQIIRPEEIERFLA